jgi:hypothetical protein
MKKIIIVISYGAVLFIIIFELAHDPLNIKSDIPHTSHAPFVDRSVVKPYGDMNAFNSQYNFQKTDASFVSFCELATEKNS